MFPSPKVHHPLHTQVFTKLSKTQQQYTTIYNINNLYPREKRQANLQTASE